MDFIIVSVIIVILVFTVSFGMLSKQKNLKKRLIKDFGNIPKRTGFVEDSVSAFHSKVVKDKGGKEFIDDMTWNDLNMDEIFIRMNCCCSSVGEEYLYHLLHNQSFDIDELRRRDALIGFFKENKELRLKLQLILSKLGISYYNKVSGLADLKADKKIKYSYLFSILAAVPIICLAIAFISLSTGITFLILSFIINLIVHYKTKKTIESDIVAISYFSSMLACANSILRINNIKLSPYTKGLKESYEPFKNLKNIASDLIPNNTTELDFVIEYVKILFLTDIRRYNSVVGSAAKNRLSLMELFRSIGEFDSSIAVLSFRESLPFYCTPEFTDSNSVTVKNLYHPLLENPIVNSQQFGKGVIITGSNASGKSTFVKAVAINSILAQTVYSCTAESFCLPMAYVISSMAVSDDITAGESYFISEIKSLKRITERPPDVKFICFIDEILKGTNTIERIAASTAMLRYLNKLNCICFTASHDIELTEILENEYDNYHFRESVTEGGIYFDYLIKEGPSMTKNAIRLLKHLEFGASIIDEANELVSRFEKTKKWIP